MGFCPSVTSQRLQRTGPSGASLDNVCNDNNCDVREAIQYQKCSFFLTLFKRGGGMDQTHVQKFWSKFCMILKAFWQHKIDIKDFLRVEMFQIEGKLSKL